MSLHGRLKVRIGVIIRLHVIKKRRAIVVVAWKSLDPDVDGDGTGIAARIFDADGTPKDINVVTGTTGDNSLIGTNVDDIIFGDDGHDILIGRGGADILIGHDHVLDGDVNTFRYTTKTDSTLDNMDTIADFVSGSDIIEFTGMVGVNDNPVTTVNIVTDLETTIGTISVTDQIYFLTDGIDGYLYVGGPGTGVDFSGTVIKLDGVTTAPADADITFLAGPNQAPTEIALNNQSVDENAIGAVIGAVTVTDLDAEDSHTLSVDDARFEIVGGQLKLKSGQSLDFESEPTVTVMVTATDQAGSGLALTESFTITVNNLNEAPTDIALTNLSVDENADGAVIGAVTVTDPDSGDSHTLAVDDARFEIVGGQLKLIAGQSLDFESESSVVIMLLLAKCCISNQLCYGRDIWSGGAILRQPRDD